MQINFFDDPEKAPKAREDVRINQLGMYLHDDRQRVAVGFDLTPFIERPSIEVTITNSVTGKEASSLHVIESLESNFTIIMHLRDKEPAELYDVVATVYYATPETERMDVHRLERTLDRTQIGEQ